MVKTVYWEDGQLYLLDQSRLPAEISYQKCVTVEEVAEAIRNLVVRGAPLIGVVAAYGVALAARNYRGHQEELAEYLEKALELLSGTRPTAVNLFQALKRMRQVWHENQALLPDQLAAVLLQEARAIFTEDVAANQAIGRYGADLFQDQVRILTICNAGALATCGYGTALGVVRSCFEQGKLMNVYACETRPVLQGARLTAWELYQDSIPVTLITDGMAGALMQAGEVDGVMVGADRITANGDTANKIGTYSLAVLSRYHQIPFYVAAPMSTIDFSLACGQQIPIEYRDPDEVRTVMGTPITVSNIDVHNPAFDVTPHYLIDAIITEKGVARPPYSETLAELNRI